MKPDTHYIDYTIKTILLQQLHGNIDTQSLELDISLKLLHHIDSDFKVDVFRGYFNDITVQVYTIDDNGRTTTLINNKYNLNKNSTNASPVVDNDRFKRAMGVI